VSLEVYRQLCTSRIYGISKCRLNTKVHNYARLYFTVKTWHFRENLALFLEIASILVILRVFGSQYGRDAAVQLIFSTCMELLNLGEKFVKTGVFRLSLIIISRDRILSPVNSQTRLHSSTPPWS